MTPPEICVFPDVASLTHDAAERIIAAASEKLADNQHFFSLVLSGGSTPKALYELLTSDPYKNRLNWSKVEIFFGDERCVPPDHPDSNYRMAYQAMLSKMPIPESSIHRMHGEIDPQQAAAHYDQVLKSRFSDDGPDFVLLGMGADGHTLSLFPGTPAVTETQRRVVANYAENSTTGKSWRITMTAPFVNRAHKIVVIVTGADKAQRVAAVLEGPKDPLRQPIQLIDPIHGTLTWLLDAAAAGMHEPE